MPRSGRWVSGALGALFLLLALIVLWTSELTWGPVLGAVIIAILGLDLVLATVRNRWPLLPGILFLP
jgi:hypothetical protein